MSQNPQSKIQNLKSGTQGVEIIGGKISGIKGEEKAVTQVSYFQGNDPSKWKTTIPTYDVVTLGEVYKGIGLKLKAYGDNVEKLFCVKPGADPAQIRIGLSGVKDCGVRDAGYGIENPKSEFQNPKLQINKGGELEVETALGTVKFTKPVAYQEIDGKRVEVGVEYQIHDCKVGEAERTQQPLKRPNPKSAIQNPKLEYGFKVASYDKARDIIIDPLLASTYLGGSTPGISGDHCQSIAIDKDGNVYACGYTYSTDFPTTAGHIKLLIRLLNPF